jgi:hypothetical protein
MFPPPKISGFEAYGHPWAMKAADLPIVRLSFIPSPNRFIRAISQITLIFSRQADAYFCLQFPLPK